MTEELVFTSARRGLQVGKSGFCTVASTPGMAANLARFLESLSGYRHLSLPGTPAAEDNPVVFSHLRSKIGGRHYSVVSRIADAGFDYSNRSNKLAHHFAFADTQSLGYGPASLLSTPENFYTSWDSDARKLKPRIPSVNAVQPQPCTTWQQTVGDAGIAADVIEAIRDRRQVYLIVNPDVPALALVREAVSLLPPDKQWHITFSTFFTKLPPNVACDIRCIMADSPEVGPARRSKSNLVLDLTAQLPASQSKWADAARNGTLIGRPTSTSTSIAGVPAPGSTSNRTAATDDQDDGKIHSQLELVDEQIDDLPPELVPPSDQSRGWNTSAAFNTSGKEKKSSKSFWIGLSLLGLVLLAAAVGGAYLLLPSANNTANTSVAENPNPVPSKDGDPTKEMGSSIDSQITASTESQNDKTQSEESIEDTASSIAASIESGKAEDARAELDTLPDEIKERAEIKRLEKELTKLETFLSLFNDLTDEINSDVSLEKKIDNKLINLRNKFSDPWAESKHKELAKLLADQRKKRQQARDVKLEEDLKQLTKMVPINGEIDALSLPECKELHATLPSILDEMEKLVKLPAKKIDGLPSISESVIADAAQAITETRQFVFDLKTRIDYLKSRLTSSEIALIALRKPFEEFKNGEPGVLFEVDRNVTSDGISFKIEESKPEGLSEKEIYIGPDPQTENRWNIYHSIDQDLTDNEIFATLHLVQEEDKTRLKISRFGDATNDPCRKLVNKNRLSVICHDGETPIILVHVSTEDRVVPTDAEGDVVLLESNASQSIEDILEGESIEIKLNKRSIDNVQLLPPEAPDGNYVIKIRLSKPRVKYRGVIPETANLNVFHNKEDDSLVAYWTFSGKCKQAFQMVGGVKLEFDFEDDSSKKPYLAIVKSHLLGEKFRDDVQAKIVEEKEELKDEQLTPQRRVVIEKRIEELKKGRGKILEHITKTQNEASPSKIGFPKDLLIPLKITGERDGRPLEAVLNLEINRETTP